MTTPSKPSFNPPAESSGTSPESSLDSQSSHDPWTRLRQFTAARIGLARSGASIATQPLLDFRLAHARARDAVHDVLDDRKLATELEQSLSQPVMTLSSVATCRQQYLMRPDLGRRLSQEAEQRLSAYSLSAQGDSTCDIVFVIADGLSACAVQMHALPLLTELLPSLAAETSDSETLPAERWHIGPIILVSQGRVAIGDEIATHLAADIAVMLIGERPGLSAPDSMGAYVTWQPGRNTTDADRNCISNIRPDGIGYKDAAFKLLHMLRSMRARRLSGVRLKDETDRLLIEDR